jgi:hypothetical protein
MMAKRLYTAVLQQFQSLKVHAVLASLVMASGKDAGHQVLDISCIDSLPLAVTRLVNSMDCRANHNMPL